MNIISFDPATAFFTLLMAIGLFWLGWKQIGALREQLTTGLSTSQQQIKTVLERSYANLLPQIDRQFESHEIEESSSKERELLLIAMEECRAFVGKTKEQNLKSCFLKYVEEWRNNKDPSYDVLMRRCSFFESLGFYCEKGYLLWEDVSELYGMPVLRTYLLLQAHIEDRRTKEGKKVFEYFVKLAEKSREIYPTYQVQDSIA